MVRRVILSSVFSIFFILELRMDQSEAQNEVDNIRKVQTFIKDYQKGYDYYRRNKLWHQKTGPEIKPMFMEMELMNFDLGYIRAQGKYGTDFNELHAIFTAHILATIYAHKLRQRLDIQPQEYRNKYFRQDSKVFYHLALYGTQSDLNSISSAIMEILETKYPESHELQFKRIMEVYVRYRAKIYMQNFGPSRIYENMDENFHKEMRDDAAELVKYIKTSFLLINPKLEDIQKSQTEIQALSEGSTPNTEILLEGSLPETQSDGSEKKIPDSTGLCIDVKCNLEDLSIDTTSLHEFFKQDPFMLFVNYDDRREKPPKNMFRSTAMNLLENLIGMIANANPNLEAGEKEKLHQPIDSFILTVPAEGYVNPNIEAKAKEKLHQPIDSFILTVPAEGDVNPNIEAEAIEELHQPMDSFILTVPADGDVYINIEAEAEEKLHQPIDSFILTVPTEGDVNPNIEAKAKEKLHQSIDSFIQTVPLEGEVLKRWLFIEISYSEMLKLYPEKDIIPANSESSWLS